MVRNLLLPVLARAAPPAPAHELQVVNNNKPQAVLGHEAARAATEFHHRHVGGVVDKNFDVRHLARGVGQTLKVAVGELPVPDPAHVDARLRAEHPHDELDGGHLQVENTYRFTLT